MTHMKKLLIKKICVPQKNIVFFTNTLISILLFRILLKNLAFTMFLILLVATLIIVPVVVVYQLSPTTQSTVKSKLRE